LRRVRPRSCRPKISSLAFERLNETVRHALEGDFDFLAGQLGLTGTLRDIEYEDLDEEQQALVCRLNLWELPAEEVQAERNLDIP